MNEWLSALTTHNGPSILVTVAHAEGSVPREAGAKMLVTSTQQFDTIGGGHLELCAIEFARNMLALSGTTSHSQKRLERFPLGPTLGQCCGGVVFLAFERIDAAALDFYIDLQLRWQRGEDNWRLVALDCGIDCAPPVLVSRIDPHDAHAVVPNLNLDLDAPCHLLRDEHDRRWMLDPCLPHRSHLYLFGAGHVGTALIRALADLPCRVTWIDERDELFPAALPDNVRCEVTDLPEALIDSAPADASYLVMTHSHALDQRLAEHILKRSDIGWFGLIGSRTKRIQFERRLRARGIPESRLCDMVCPIGIDGIDGKAPAMIAIAVAAQLLQVWEQKNAVRNDADSARHQESRT